MEPVKERSGGGRADPEDEERKEEEEEVDDRQISDAQAGHQGSKTARCWLFFEELFEKGCCVPMFIHCYCKWSPDRLLVREQNRYFNLSQAVRRILAVKCGTLQFCAFSHANFVLLELVLVYLPLLGWLGGQERYLHSHIGNKAVWEVFSWDVLKKPNKPRKGCKGAHRGSSHQVELSLSDPGLDLPWRAPCHRQLGIDWTHAQSTWQLRWVVSTSLQP
ncbi:hypothetical protein BDK51DRAFT_32017 [Blyttiomyces helicus]|uniref:Uncharacterized protein n=1 Tax=Blyttiomyces helicus TaxID=388810 RepID=A0A4V1ISP7_9FUNG|nr:hypothetical protein BDK51DRAFT_32017 [Blyttiomyces helicus]|eukprot:RKO94297.1 hypothetical protein BDK51DRAFT_32017 [Blyttiomyces helicus]